MPEHTTDLVFPARVIPLLRNLSGPSWAALVERVISLSAEHPQKLAFMLLMARLAHCETCTPTEYRALQGCAYCAVQTLKRFRGTEADLLRLYQQALRDVEAFLEVKKDD